MEVLCVGHAAWDISVFLDAFPVENSKCEIRTMCECGGGPAANAACLLSRWGVSCGIAAVVGADGYGDRIRNELRAAGVDVAWLKQDPACPTPVSVILVNQRSGSRTIVNRKAVHCDMQLTPPSPSAPKPRVLLFDGHELEASRQAMALFPDARTILDAGSLRDGTQELASHVDYLVSSERFACQLSGAPDLKSRDNQARAMAVLYACNRKPVVITRGEQGMLYGAGDEFEQLPAFPVSAVDTTAAGDIFHGAFAYAVLRGLTDHEALRLAAAAAALSTTARGSSVSIPSLSQVQEMLRHAG